MPTDIETAEERGYSRGYQAKRKEGVDHRQCLEKQGQIETALIEAHAEITRLDGQIDGMTTAMTLLREKE